MVKTEVKRAFRGKQTVRQKGLQFPSCPQNEFFRALRRGLEAKSLKFRKEEIPLQITHISDVGFLFVLLLHN